jgi:hypothetical protein
MNNKTFVSIRKTRRKRKKTSPMAQTTPVWRRLGSSRRRRRPTPTPHCCRCPVVYSVDYNLIELNVSSSPGCPAVSWSWNIFAISFRKLSNKTFIRIKKTRRKRRKNTPMAQTTRVWCRLGPSSSSSSSSSPCPRVPNPYSQLLSSLSYFLLLFPLFVVVALLLTAC